MDYIQLSKRIKELCDIKHKSISNMIADCNLSKSFIYDLEKRNQSPSLKTIVKIANYFGVSIDYLLGADDEGEIYEIISALPDKNDNIVTMRIAAFGGGVHEVKVSKDDLRDVVNMLEEDDEEE